jgi:tetratricopeptide (TPR) repeat protein
MSDQVEFQLEDELTNQMVTLKEEGDKVANKGNYQQAIEFYQKAYNLLPEPREKWEATTWILGIIGDAYFLNREYAKAFEVLNLVLLSPGAIGNPFIHLRLGQCALELKHEDRAKDELMRAYMGAGEEIFLYDHPKYLEFLARYAKIKVTKLAQRRRRA